MAGKITEMTTTVDATSREHCKKESMTRGRTVHCPEPGSHHRTPNTKSHKEEQMIKTSSTLVRALNSCVRYWHVTNPYSLEKLHLTTHEQNM